MRMHERTDASGARKPPNPRDIRLEDIDRSALDELAEAKDTELAFAGGNRDALPRPYALIPIQVIRRHRLFNPRDIGSLQLAPDLDGRRGVIGAVDIQHDVDAGTYRLTDGLNRGHIHTTPTHLCGPADLHLQCRVAATHLVGGLRHHLRDIGKVDRRRIAGDAGPTGSP